MELHFLGAAHNDPEAYNRTIRGLERLRPDVLALEWEGPEYENFLQNPAIKALRAQTEEAIRDVFCEFKIDPGLYDQANAKSIWGGEVKAVQDFARQYAIEIVPTESAHVRIEVDLESLHNPEIGAEMFYKWLSLLKKEEKTYDPDEITAFDPSTYGMFERHLDGKMAQDEASKIVKDSMWAFRPERVRYQTEKLREAVDGMNKKDRLVHVGGFLHLMDDGLSQAQGPVNLWQHARMNLGGNINRYSLSGF